MPTNMTESKKDPKIAPQPHPQTTLAPLLRLKLSSSATFFGSSSVAISPAKKPSGREIMIDYSRQLILHSQFEHMDLLNHRLFPSKQWDSLDFSTDLLFRSSIIDRLFDIHRQHASSGGFYGGPFHDTYTREGLIPSIGMRHSLAYMTCMSPSAFNVNFFQYVYSYDMLPIIKEYQRKYPFFDQIQLIGPIFIEDFPVGYIIAPINHKITNFIYFLGSIGALPPRDIMLKIYTKRFNSSLHDAIQTFGAELSYRLQENLVYELSPMVSGIQPDHPILKDLEKMHGLELIIKELESSLSQSHLEMNTYYYKVTLAMVKGLEKTLTLRPGLILAVKRISDLICISQSADYFEFINCISLIWDELRWLSKPRSRTFTLYDETINTLKIYSQTISDYRPVHATLGSSGMGVLVKSIHSAIKELTHDGGIAALNIGKYSYFELPVFLKQYIVGYDLTDDPQQIIYTDGYRAIMKPQGWPDGLVSLYIDIPFANVHLETSGYHYTHINDFIEEQLILRETIAKAPPLICIFDTTVGYSNDVFIKWTLTQFEEAIKQGKLYIFFVHSLNKFWTMGLDKGNAGFGHQYGQLDYFPQLKQTIENDQFQWNLGGQSLSSSTVSMIKLIMSNCADMIDTYSEYIKARSRYVYTKVLNSLVESKTNYIVIDDPNSYPIIKGQSTPLMELGDFSTFVTIRLNPHYDLRPHFIQLFYKFTVSVLNNIGINHRAGYGFAETTATFINANDRKIIIRISIGSEEPDVLVENFNQLKKFFVQFNRVISTYFPFTQVKS